MGKFLANLSSILVYLPLGLGIYSYYRNKGNLAFKVLIFIFIIWGVIEAESLYLAKQKANNLFWLNLNCIITTVLFIIYYYLINDFSKKILYYSLGIYISFTFFWFQLYGIYNVWAIPYIIASNIILIALSAYSLMQLINREQEDLFGFYEFWIHAGVLVYFTGSILYLSIFRIIIKSNDFSFIDNLQNVHSIINSIGNLLYTIAFICLIRNYKRKFNLQS